MANPEHLAILKKGVKEWNRWKGMKGGAPDLSLAMLRNAQLNHADLRYVILEGANLSGADLRSATLSQANLSSADLRSANLSQANLCGADLDMADLSGANLGGANLSLARLTTVNLSQANLCEADLRSANLSFAKLTSVNLTKARFNDTALAATDLSCVEGLDEVLHSGPSSIGIDTFFRSKDKIPMVFLRGSGVPEDFIAFAKGLAKTPVTFYSCFISYSSDDQVFAEKLHADLQDNGVRCWFYADNMRIGDQIRLRIDESIWLYNKLLLVLSEQSVHSQWVEQEVEKALEKERKTRSMVLFPIRLDDAVMKIEFGWPSYVRNTRNIGDFTDWKDHDSYKKAFERLLRDLRGEKMDR